MKKGFLKSAWTKTGAVRVAVSDAVAGSTSPDRTRHHPRPGNTIRPYSPLSPQKRLDLLRLFSEPRAHQEQSQKPSRSRCQGSTTRPKIGRLAPAAVLTIEAYGCTGHSSSSTSSRHPRPSKLTDAPVSSSPFILRPVTSTSANTRGSVLSSRWTASMICRLVILRRRKRARAFKMRRVASVIPSSCRSPKILFRADM
ncbi:hypothetical protein ACLKA6_010057 [Drosophila palustris]